MYIPKAFREDDVATLHALMRRYSFATLVSDREGEPFATHLPLLVRPEPRPYGTLVGHVAHANPHWRGFADGRSVLAIFQGPHGYITPSWYAQKPDNVPTWNYAAVHAYGTPRLIDDDDELYSLLHELIQTHEAGYARPWSPPEPDDAVRSMMGAIVGFYIEITRLEGKLKLNQNRSEADQQRVVAGLEGLGDPESAALAQLMRDRREARSG